ncbi:MAG: hypothetical protein ACRCX2_10070 [Paraclostridium sp.]
MATYRLNGKTYKIGTPKTLLEKFTCEHIDYHARMIEKTKDLINHIKQISGAGITVNDLDLPRLSDNITWHEKHLEKYCIEYQNPLKVFPLKKK